MNHLFDGLLSDVAPARQFAEIPGGPTRYYSYQDVLDVSARFANAIKARGVRPGDRVAVQVPKSIEAVMLYLGVVRVGAVFLPLNTAYTAAEVEYFLSDAEPTLFVADPAREDELSSLASRLSIPIMTLGVWRTPDEPAGSLAAEALGTPTNFDTVARGPSELAAILYTSGTTGRSKGAMLSHDNLLSNAIALRDLWRFTQDDVLIHALPIFHTHGLFVATNITLSAGGELIFQPGFNMDAIFDAMDRATSMMGVPTFYTRLLKDERLTLSKTSRMRLFVSGSAPLLAETHMQWRERTGHAILERYGMTETNMNTSNPYDGDRRPGTVGRALPGVDVNVCDEAGKLVPPGDIGTIEVRGPNVFQGYWRMPEKTAEELRPNGFFITGDLGQYDEDGYLTIVGRSKDLVISGGYNVYPKEVEEAIDGLAGVTESAVIGVPHPDFGEGVVAVIVPASQSTLTEQSIKADLAGTLAGYKQPKKVIFVYELPRNTMGKVQKAALRNTYAELFV